MQVRMVTELASEESHTIRSNSLRCYGLGDDKLDHILPGLMGYLNSVAFLTYTAPVDVQKTELLETLHVTEL